MSLSSVLLISVVYSAGIFLSVIFLLSDGIQEIREFLIKHINDKSKKWGKNKKWWSRILMFFPILFKKSIECNICFSFWINLFWLLYTNYLLSLLNWYELLSFSFLYTVCAIVLFGIIKWVFKEK